MEEGIKAKKATEPVKDLAEAPKSAVFTFAQWLHNLQCTQLMFDGVLGVSKATFSMYWHSTLDFALKDCGKPWISTITLGKA